MAEDTAASTAPAASTTNDSVGDSGVASVDVSMNTNAEEVKPEVAGNDTAEQHAASDSKTNGHTEHHDPPISSKAEAADDVEMKDADENSEGAVIQPSSSMAAVNGTPASTKKTSNGSSKKKSSVIPEHKSKKLNKKKSKPVLRLEAMPGDLFLARMKGHQPWPSIICDEEMLPQILLSSRPITTAQPDGTFKKPEYADGGKRAAERTFPIMFLQTNEFAWIINSELSPLTPEECKDIADKGKSKSLLEAYKIASEGHDLAYFKAMLADHMAAMQEDADEKAEREAKKASKAKRKSGQVSAVTADDEDADEMDVDEDGAESKPKSKKRKKSLESDGDEKPAKTPKTGTKLKLSTPKTPTVDSSSKKKAIKAKSSAKKSAAKASASDDEMTDTPMVEEKPLTPAEAKEKKEKEIRYYRHKLQKGFLSRDTVPAEEEIKSMSGFLSKLETYPDLEGSIIRATKIHKVLKAMIRLTSIPKDEEYQFKKRSHELLTKWNKILQDDPTPGGDKDDDAKDDVKPEAATTNGTGKETEEEVAKAEAGDAAAPEEESENALERKIGTTVEGEKEAAESATTAPAETAEEVKTDAPNVDSAPTAEYQPPAQTSEATEAS
ncbi:hypothetical protein MMC17_001291 [Xylographa soralifera]|nr:hypothetical protein [Xylographa soralifera]